MTESDAIVADLRAIEERIKAATLSEAGRDMIEMWLMQLVSTTRQS